MKVWFGLGKGTVREIIEVGTVYVVLGALLGMIEDKIYSGGRPPE
jgi:hypothetical protein